MNITLLDTASIGTDIDFSPITDLGNSKVYAYSAQDDVKYLLADADVAVLNKIKITKEIIDACPNLKLVCVSATGYDNIDTAYCREKGVAVANVPGYSTDSVAMVTVATVLNLLTKMTDYSDFVRSGRYTESGMPNRLSPVFNDLSGKTWGIVGYGNIGKKVADVARAFGCKVLYNRNTPDGSSVDIDTLCKECDIISLHCPLNQATEKLINAERIALMKKSAVIVNAARGKVWDEKAIADAVRENRIGGMGCDVYSAEPFGKDHPFYEIKDCDNVCLTPHMAWASFEARTKVVTEMALNIQSFLKGESRNRVE